MIIWFLIFIPALTALILSFGFRKRVTWQEYLLVLGVPIILIVTAKFTSEYSQTRATEYWGGWMLTAEYYEDWNERVSCRHPKYRTETDSDGDTHQVFDGYEHSYDVDDHPPYWKAVDSNGSGFRLNSVQFEILAKKFGNRTFVDLHRSYHTKDGDKYVTKWTGTPESLELTTVAKTYENRVQASDSVFNYPPVENAKELGLYEHPKIQGWYQPVVLGLAGPTSWYKLELLNALHGARSKVRVYVLAWQGKGMDVAVKQEAYWKNGNKNELVICVGTDSKFQPQWCRPFGWTQLEDLKIGARDLIMGQKQLDLVALSGWLEGKVKGRVVRRDFREFDYLSVNPPFWVIVLTAVVVFMTSIGLAWWSVVNDFRYEERRRSW